METHALSLQEIQSETLKIMKRIDTICRAEHLKYSLFYGTLLGAVRHGGFIPWDDDLDIIMPRNDYDRLAEYFKNHERDVAPLRWFSYETVSDYPYMIARVSNTDFRMETENEYDCGMGTFVDIYPLDGAGNGKSNIFYNKAWFFASMYFTKSRIRYVVPKGFAKNIVKGCSFVLSKILSREKIRTILLRYAKRFPYENSDYVGCMIWLVDGRKNIFRKADFDELIEWKFEDVTFFITKNYDGILTTRYGNWKKLPPEHERIGHHFYKIYRK
ncbi:MAG: LicD family protein [Treponema sp.]|nr:LicD family protein [Treponema sp.]